MFQYNKQKFIQKNNQGFTLVELLVATSIFVVVMVLGLSVLMSVNNANKKSQAMRSVMDNLNFAMENMSRNIRYGYNYGCGAYSGAMNFNTNCDFSMITDNPIAGSSSIIFQIDDRIVGPQKKDTYIYQLKFNYTGTVPTGYIERCISPWGYFPYECAPITAPDLNVTTLRFSVVGAVSGDARQPGVGVFVEGVAMVGKEQSPFKLQTFFTQRQYEQ